MTEFSQDGYAWAVDLVVARLGISRKLSEADVSSRIAAQMPAQEKMALADEILYNDGNLDDLRRRVEQIWSALAGTPPAS